MPTYDYECPKCGHRFELFQRITEKPRQTCPSCKSRGVRRLIGTGAGLLFKGSGFYITDYRSDSYHKAAKAEKSAPAAASPTPSTSSTTSAPATPAKPAASKSGGSGGKKTTRK